MELSRIVGALVFATAMATTGARAQDVNTQQAQANETASAQQANEAAKGDDTAGETTGADGIPVPKPNPISRFMKEDKAFQDMPIQQSLVDDYREDNQSK